MALTGRAVSIPDRNQGSNWMLVKTGHKTGQKAEKERLQRHMPVSPQQSGAGAGGNAEGTDGERDPWMLQEER